MGMIRTWGCRGGRHWALAGNSWECICAWCVGLPGRSAGGLYRGAHLRARAAGRAQTHGPLEVPLSPPKCTRVHVRMHIGVALAGSRRALARGAIAQGAAPGTPGPGSGSGPYSHQAGGILIMATRNGDFRVDIGPS